jgi:hypothetical protein
LGILLEELQQEVLARRLLEEPEVEKLEELPSFFEVNGAVGRIVDLDLNLMGLEVEADVLY